MQRHRGVELGWLRGFKRGLGVGVTCRALATLAAVTAVAVTRTALAGLALGIRGRGLEAFAFHGCHFQHRGVQLLWLDGRRFTGFDRARSTFTAALATFTAFTAGAAFRALATLATFTAWAAFATAIGLERDFAFGRTDLCQMGCSFQRLAGFLLTALVALATFAALAAVAAIALAFGTAVALALRAAVAAFGALTVTAGTIAALGTFTTAFTAFTTAATAFTAAFAMAITATFTVAVTRAIALATATAAFAWTAFTAGFTRFACGRRFRRCGCRCHGNRCGTKAKQVLEPGKEALLARCSGGGTRGSCRPGCGRTRSAGGRRGCRCGSARCGFGTGLGHGCRRIAQHALDDGRLLVGRLLRAARHGGVGFDFIGQLVARVEVFQARVVVLEALELVVRRFQRLVGHHQHRHALLEFDLGDLGALFIEQERGHFHRHLAVHGGGVVLHGLFLDDAQDLQRRAFGVADMARTTAAWAVDVRAFGQGGLEALAAHFHQAELADAAELHAGTVLAQRVAQAVLDLAAVLRLFHVDEVDDDQAAQIAQAHLARDFVGGFQVGARGGFLDVATLDGAGRVHVDRNQGFGVVDHDGAARGQGHGARVGRFDLVLDLETAEQRCVIAVALDPGSVLGHHVRHELLGLFVDVVGIDEDVTDLVVEVVADGADHQARFLIDQERALALGGTVDGAPQLEQIVQIPLQFGRAAADAGGARDDAHTLGVLELVHRFLELGPVFAFDAARDATAARVVGHQHHIAAGQRDEGGQGRALVAAFFLFDLDQHFLAFADHIIDARLAGRHAIGEVLARDFLERQETVAVFAVVDKTGFEGGFDAGDDRLVDVALALLAAFDFNFVVQQFLAVDNGQTAFFGLGSVDKHPFHDAFPLFVMKTRRSAAIRCRTGSPVTLNQRRALSEPMMPG